MVSATATCDDQHLRRSALAVEQWPFAPSSQKPVILWPMWLDEPLAVARRPLGRNRAFAEIRGNEAGAADGQQACAEAGVEASGCPGREGVGACGHLGGGPA